MQMQYELDLQKDQVVLFLDIIAFSNAIYSNENTDESTEGLRINLSSFQKDIFDYYSDAYLNTKQIKFIFISDSIFITTHYKNINQLMLELIHLTNVFYNMGFSLRGGISYGKTYAGVNLWGPAVCNAARYEKYADFPCVVIPIEDYKQLNLAKEISDFFVPVDQTKFNKLFEEFKKQFYYFDFFGFFIKSLIDNGHDAIPFISISAHLISDQFCRAKDEQKHKWKFLAQRLISTIIVHSDYISQKHLDAECTGAQKRYLSVEEYSRILAEASM